MIIRLVKLTLEEGSVKDFLVQFRQVKNLIRAFDGCKHLELLQDVSSPGVVFTHSIWESQEKLEGYLASDLFKSTWKQVKPLFVGKAEAWSLKQADEVIES